MFSFPSPARYLFAHCHFRHDTIPGGEASIVRGKYRSCLTSFSSDSIAKENTLLSSLRFKFTVLSLRATLLHLARNFVPTTWLCKTSSEIQHRSKLIKRFEDGAQRRAFAFRTLKCFGRVLASFSFASALNSFYLSVYIVSRIYREVRF